MKLRTLRRTMSRRWDSVNSSFHNDDGMPILRGTKPCPTYAAGCVVCESARFPRVYGRFPFSANEFWEFVNASDE